MTQPDPQDLARRAAQRDTDAFAQLYDEHLNTVYRYVFHQVGERTLAEDLTSEVFSKAWVSISRYQWRNVPFQHWLLRIAHHVVIDHWRAHQRTTTPLESLREAASDGLAPDDVVAQDQQAAILRACMLRLPPDQRNVLVLRFVEGCSHADVARIVGKSEVAVRQIQVRGLRALQKLMRGLEEIELVAGSARGVRTAPAGDPEPSEEPAG